jgi:hypothetical protein
MLRHPKGYRPYVPPAELLLGTISGLVLVLAALSLGPDLMMTGRPFHYVVDAPPPPSYWSPIGWLLVVASLALGGWAFWVRRNIGRLQKSVPVWLFSIIALLLMWLQCSIIEYWMANFFSD